MNPEHIAANFNEVQLQILTSLTTSNGIRYSTLKPKDIENDLYKYHLKHLLNKGFVHKADSLYFITTKGKKVTTNISAVGRVEDLFKISLALYPTKVIEGKEMLLVQRRNRHPFMNDVSSVSGKIRRGEMFEDGAKRKLLEETNLDGDFKFLGVHRKIRYDKDNNILEDTFYHVCYSDNVNGNLIAKNQYGENFWVTFDEAIEFKKNNVDTGEISVQIIQRIKDKNFENFYLTEKIHVRDY